MHIPKDVTRDIVTHKTDQDWLSVEEELDDEDIIVLVQAIQQNPMIKMLNLVGNSITDKGIQALATLNLYGLTLMDSAVTPIGAGYLAGSSIVKLNLSGNSTIGNAGALALAKSSSLRCLNLNHCEIGNEGASAILSNPYLEELSLSGNYFDDNAMTGIILGPKLKIIDLSHNRIRSNGVESIALHPGLKKVILEANLIDDIGAIILARTVSIIELDLCQNFLTEKGFLAFCQNRSIQILRLFGNKICFTKNIPLPGNTSLMQLYLGHNKIKSSPEIPLRSFATSFPSLTTLNLDGNEIVGSVVALPPSPPVSAVNPVIFTPTHKRALPGTTQDQERVEDSPPRKVAALVASTPQYQEFVHTATPEQMQEFYRALQEASDLARLQQSSLSDPPLSLLNK